VYHPLSGQFPFVSSAVAYSIDAAGRSKSMVDTGNYDRYDQAVAAVLRQHEVFVPRPLQPSVVVRGRGCRSRVSREYTGKKAAPLADMPHYMRVADSTATRIRMNARRVDPLTGDRVAGAPPRPEPLVQPITSARFRAMYRGIVWTHRQRGGDDAMLDRHLAALALSPEHHHRLVSAHMLASPTGGLHIGNKKAIEMKGAQTWATHKQGKTITHDRPNEKVGGVYYPKLRQLVLPDDTHSGSISTGSHELGHALDSAWGAHLSGSDTAASHLPHFQQVYNEVTHMHDGTKTVLNPYYTDLSTSDGPKEMWAEGYAAWLHGRDLYRTADERALLVGNEIGAAPTEKLRVGRVLMNYFDLQDEKMRSTT